MASMSANKPIRSRLRKWLWFALMVLLVLAAMLTVAAYLAYRAATHVPDFYEQSLAIDPQLQEEASERLLKKSTALVNETKRQGDWATVFTEEEINGWLAVDLVENHREALPQGVSEPRVRIAKETLTLACRAERRGFRTVVTVTLNAYVSSPNTVVVRVKDARAGLLPLPIDELMEKAVQGANKAGWGARRLQQDGDPVLMLTAPDPADSNREVVELHRLEIDDGEIRIAGTTRKSS